MSFNVSEEKEWVSQYKKIWNEVESQLFEKTGDRINKRRRQVSLWQVEKVEKTHKNKFSWSGRSIPYVLQFNGSVKDLFCLKNYQPQTYVEECKFTDAEKQQCNILSDDDDGFFEV